MLLVMSDEIAKWLPANPVKSAPEMLLTEMRPAQLVDLMEIVWRSPRDSVRQKGLGGTAARQIELGRESTLDDASLFDRDRERNWPHLVYAALLEQTRIVEIFRNVLFEWLHGERLPKPSENSQQWLYVTEKVWFSDLYPYSISSVTSHIRPDRGAVRRNAYWRMFGWEPQQELAEAAPFHKAEATNREFTTLLEALLVEIWRAYSNQGNSSGPKETDLRSIVELARRLREMLTSRRMYGTLSREEFDAVAMLSWFHLTVESENSVMRDLQAAAIGTADKLKLVGAAVGVPAHSRSDSFLRLAEPLSDLLIEIEGDEVTDATVEDYFRDGFAFTNRMLTIINHWSIVTGRNLKDPSLRRPLGDVMRAIEANWNASQKFGRVQYAEPPTNRMMVVR